MMAPRTWRSVTRRLSASDRLQLAADEAVDPLVLPAIDVDGAIKADGDAVRLGVQEQPGRAGSGRARDASPCPVADDVCRVDASVRRYCERDGQSDIAAERRDEPGRKVDSSDAPVLGVRDIEGAVATESDRVRVRELGACRRAAVARVALGAVARQDAHGPVRCNALHVTGIDRDVEVALRV